jgi:hypothetical protein
MLPFFSGSTRASRRNVNLWSTCAQKAKFFHEALGLEGKFNASTGWLTRFKQQYGIRKIAVQGKRLGANDVAANTFHMEFQKFVQEENLNPDQICNGNVSGLYWKGLPTRTLGFERQKCAPEHKSSKNTLWLCAVEMNLEITK